MSKKALVRALTELDFSTLALKIKTLPKGTVPKTGVPSETLDLLSEILDEDFSEAVACLVSQEKLNAIHKERLECALSLTGVTVEDDFKLGYSVRKDAPASEIYEHNSKNPRPEVIGALLSVDKAAKENRTKLAVALKEAGMTDLADALPARLYTSHTTPSDILFAGFIWRQSEEGYAAWREAYNTLNSIESENNRTLKILQKIDPTLKSIEQLNYCKSVGTSTEDLYRSKVRNQDETVLKKPAALASSQLKMRAIEHLRTLDLHKAADYVENMEFDLPSGSGTSVVIDSFIWRDHEAGYAFWVEVFKKVLQAEKVTYTNKEKLVAAVKELGYHDKAEALKDIRFTLSGEAYSPARTLTAGFGWHSSPQGSDYWNSLHKALMQAELTSQEKEKEMSMSTNQKTLITTLKKLGELEAAAHIEKMDGSIFEHDTPKGLLEYDFRWNSTPQGYMFWLGVDARVNGLVKSAEWHDACKVRKTNLIQACFDAGRKDAAKLVKALPYELFHAGETPVKVAQRICRYSLDKETGTFWEGLRKDLEKVSNCTAELAAKKRLIDAVYEVTGRKFDTLAELPLSAFSGLTVPTAENLIRAFDWYESVEGEDFWQGVHGKLEARQTVTVTVFTRNDFWRRVSAALQTPKEGKTGTPHLINMHDTYKTRDGRDVRVVRVDALDDDYKVVALVKNADGTSESIHEFTATGRFCSDEQGDDDLVLHSTKDPRDSLKIDDPVYVRNSGEWQLQYYAGKTPEGAHSVWAFGKKSIDRTAMQITWSRWKVNGVELSA